METDAWIILALSILLWRADTSEAWMLASGLMRHALVAAAWLWPWINWHLPLSLLVQRPSA